MNNKAGLGININGERITHLRFADHIVILVESIEEFSTMLWDLRSVSHRVGLKMKMDKTKIMSNVHVTPIPVVVDGTIHEVVDEYIYLPGTSDQYGPIVGSYSYDPVKQIFELEEITNNNTAQIPHKNETNVSTKELRFIRNRSIAARSRLYRKHVSITAPRSHTISTAAHVQQSKLNNWWTKWTKPKSQNVTKSI